MNAKTTAKKSNCCDAQVQRHQLTTIQRIALHKSGGCTRKGKTAMRHVDGSKVMTFCATHARMASEGFVEVDGSVMSASDRSNYQSGRCKGNPYDFGKWSAV